MCNGADLLTSWLQTLGRQSLCKKPTTQTGTITVTTTTTTTVTTTVSTGTEKSGTSGGRRLAEDTQSLAVLDPATLRLTGAPMSTANQHRSLKGKTTYPLVHWRMHAHTHADIRIFSTLTALGHKSQ